MLFRQVNERLVSQDIFWDFGPFTIDSIMGQSMNITRANGFVQVETDTLRSQDAFDLLQSAVMSYKMMSCRKAKYEINGCGRNGNLTAKTVL